MSEKPEGGPLGDTPDEPTERGANLRLFGIVSVVLLVVLLLIFLATR